MPVAASWSQVRWIVSKRQRSLSGIPAYRLSSVLQDKGEQKRERGKKRQEERGGEGVIEREK